MERKLLIPGPIQVRPDVLQAQTRPMVGHRGPEYSELQKRVIEKLRAVLGLKGGHVFLFTSSGTGGMEAAVRNLVRKRLLNVTCGAFGERWHQVARGHGIPASLLAAEWGKGNHAEDVEAALKDGFDAVAVTHSETSTGVLNHLDEIGQVLKSHPDVLYCVDAVSSMAGVPIDVQGWGIDFIFAGTQKAWGLPPGLTIVYASDRAIERAKTVKNRGYYFDLLKFVASNEKNQTPETPVIPLIQALDFQLDRMLGEGMEVRFARNRENAIRIREWFCERGFSLFPEKGYEGLTLTCVENRRGIDVGRFVTELRRRGFEISNGYGKLKGKTFRIAHMGDLTWEDDLQPLLTTADEVLKSLS